MAKKRKKRNNRSVTKALKRKRAFAGWGGSESTPPTNVPWSRETSTGKWLGGAPADSIVFNTQQESQDYSTKLNNERLAQQQAREAAAANPDPMRGVMSVSEPGIGTTTYTAEGGAQTPTGYIAPAVPKVQDTITKQWTAPQPEPRTGQRDAPPLTQRRDVPDRDPTARQQKAISEALGLSLEEVQAMPLDEAKRLYNIQQKTQDAALWQEEYAKWQKAQVGTQDPPSDWQAPELPSWWYNEGDPSKGFDADARHFITIMNRQAGYDWDGSGDGSYQIDQGGLDQYNKWTSGAGEWGESYGTLTKMYNDYRTNPEAMDASSKAWFEANFPTDRIPRVKDDDDPANTDPDTPIGTERTRDVPPYGSYVEVWNGEKWVPQGSTSDPNREVSPDATGNMSLAELRQAAIVDPGGMAANVLALRGYGAGTQTPTTQMPTAKLGVTGPTESGIPQKLTGDYADMALPYGVDPFDKTWKGEDSWLKADTTPQAEAITASTIDRAETGVDETSTARAAEDVTTLTREASPEELATLRERAQATERDLAQEREARAGRTEYDISADAKVQQVDFRQTTSVSATQEDEISTREAITSTAATSENAQQIVDTFGFGSTRKQIMDSLKASTANAAATSLAQNSNLSQQAASTVVSNPGALNVTEPAIVAAVAELPEEALVSGQMDKLLEGLEDNKVPAWAKPAVDAVDSIMVQRGLQSSSVGRDSLFNAIIQSAFPIAQANAQALQTRAAQNLTNQQQSLIQENQIAADFLSKNAAFKQQMELANLNNEQQMKLANLSARNQTESENLSAEQQTDLANLNARMQTNLLQAQLAEKMGVAQLNVDQQRAVQNAGMVANLDMAQFNADQQVELANSKFMQTMTLTDFNAEQQEAMQNATALASLDMATVDQRTKVAAQNAQSFLQLDMANLTNEQQAAMLSAQQIQQRVLSNQSFDNAAQQFNATSENQLNQFMSNMATQINLQNTTQTNAMTQFNSNQQLKAQQINKANKLQIQQFNNQMEYQTDQWNAANAQAVEQSNVEWRRKANTVDTAAENQSNQINVQNAFNMQSSALSQIWQQLRDSATFAVQMSTNNQDRAARIIENALANGDMMDENEDPRLMARDLYNIINTINGTSYGPG